MLADADVNILDIVSHTDRQSMESIMDINMEIPDLPTLSTVIAKLERLPNVVSARRKS